MADFGPIRGMAAKVKTQAMTRRGGQFIFGGIRINTARVALGLKAATVGRINSKKLWEAISATTEVVDVL